MDATEVTVRHRPDTRRFELVDDGKVIGEAHYLPYDAAQPERIFHHTVVDEAYGGQGLGSKLATFALDDTIAAGLKIVPVCSYISAFVSEHEKYQANTVDVAQEHLDALRAAD